MANKHTLHCWMRVIPDTKYKIKIPQKPPKRISKTKPAEINEVVWTGYEGLFNEKSGVKWVLDFGQAFHKKQEALDWLEDDEEGQQWKADAVSWSLVAFKIDIK